MVTCVTGEENVKYVTNVEESWLDCEFVSPAVSLSSGWMFSRSGLSPGPTWQQWLWVNGFLLAALAVVGVFSVVVGLLLGCHLYLVSINSTTWEFMSRHRILYLKDCREEDNPFDRGSVCNLWDFFCSCRTVMWEQVYQRSTADPV